MSFHSNEPDPRYIDLTDGQLVAAHCAGDTGAFGELARRHVKYLHNVARKVVKSAVDADDVVQTALVAALRSSASYQGRSAVRTGLTTITINAAIDFARRWAPPLDDAQAREPGPGRGRADDPAEIIDGQLTVERLLDRLTPTQRRMVLMVDLLGYSVRETAEHLGVAEGTVKSGRSRAFRALARRLP